MTQFQAPVSGEAVAESGRSSRRARARALAGVKLELLALCAGGGSFKLHLPEVLELADSVLAQQYERVGVSKMIDVSKMSV